MKIECIFELIKDRLYAVKYQGADSHAFNELMEQWTDVSWLFEFFSEHEKDLKEGIYTGIEVDDAIEDTIREAENFFEYIGELQGENLDEAFEPLGAKDQRAFKFSRMKAKGEYIDSWLRIYAVKYDQGYIITGGAIKLTAKMQDRLHTRLELQKLNFIQTELHLGNFEGLVEYQ